MDNKVVRTMVIDAHSLSNDHFGLSSVSNNQKRDVDPGY